MWIVQPVLDLACSFREIPSGHLNAHAGFHGLHDLWEWRDLTTLPREILSRQEANASRSRLNTASATSRDGFDNGCLHPGLTTLVPEHILQCFLLQTPAEYIYMLYIYLRAIYMATWKSSLSLSLCQEGSKALSVARFSHVIIGKNIFIGKPIGLHPCLIRCFSFGLSLIVLFYIVIYLLINLYFFCVKHFVTVFWKVL